MTYGSRALEVLGGGLDVVGDILYVNVSCGLGKGGIGTRLHTLGEIDHVGGEEGVAGALELLLIGGDHAIEPGQKLLAVVEGQFAGYQD